MPEHVSETLKRAASSAIDSKIALLKKWKKSGIPWQTSQEGNRLKDEDGISQMDFFPDDVQAFCLWTARDNCAATIARFPELQEFRTISRTTLGQDHNLERRERVTTLLKVLQARARLQQAKVNPQSQNVELRAERDYWKQVAIQGERDVLRQRQIAAEAQTQLRKEMLTRRNNEDVLNADIERLQEQIAQLTAQLAKLIPLRGTK